MASRKPGTRRLSPEARRAQLIASTLPVFARQGFHGAGTRALAGAAGVSEPILYRHFDGKEGLFLAVLEESVTRIEGTLAVRPEERKQGAAARLEALAARLPEVLERHRDELRVVNAAALVHEEAPIQAAAGHAATRLGDALSTRMRGTGLRPGVTATTAGYLLLEVGMGLAMLSPLDVPAMDDGHFRSRALAALLHGIIAQPT